jgi:cyclopropane fatty-acyl-phospholipid synthase-like methyltransferase
MQSGSDNEGQTKSFKEIYQAHYLDQHAILNRIRQAGGNLQSLTPLDLAVDDVTGITDQNHVGGLEFVEALSQKAGVNANMTILDIGAGLGGAARYLAFRHGCKVHGLDVTAKRVQEANALTQMTNLTHLVTFQVGDALTVDLPERKFDLLWGQNSWIHIADKEKLLHRWSTILQAHGIIALEDISLRSQPAPGGQEGELTQLEDIWQSKIEPVEHWTTILADLGFEISLQEDLSEAVVPWFSSLSERTKIANAHEIQGWKLAIQLALTGVIGYFRVIAKKKA